MTDFATQAAIYPRQVGNFNVTALLGVGGMGAVFLAEHGTLGTLVAIKFLKPEWSTNAEIRRRFSVEAKAAATLKHPNIMPVLDFGEVNGVPYIQMPYYEGKSLARLVAERGALPAPDVSAIMQDVCAAVQAAHDKGIIHRDLKPDNVWICNPHGDGQRALVLDFGIAKVNEELAGGAKTRTGVTAGTPSYMAPEQLGGEPVTTRSDIFALGLILNECLTGGKNPFQLDDEPSEVFHNLTTPALYLRQVNAHEYGMPIDPRRRNRAISDAVAMITLRAIDRYPARRIQSARELGVLIKNATEVRDIVNMLETVRSSGRARGAAAPWKYELGPKIGQGGMAEVFLANFIGAAGFKRTICMKRVLPEYSNQPAFAKMFTDEAKLAARLQHPNVVTVYDFDRDPDGRLYIAMEYVAGKDLSALAATGPLPPSLVAHIGVEMLNGAAHMHGHKLVHRDISPHNLLLSWDGLTKLTDFGIAKARDLGGPQSLALKGKPAYMSPEQIDCVPDLDGRSDLYAIGIVLWEVLTGRRLYSGSYEAIFTAIKHRDPPRPSSVIHGVPPDLEAVIMKLLARDREQRYRTAEEAMADLRRCESFPSDGGAALAHVLAQRFAGAPAGATLRSVDAPPSQPTRSAPTSNLRVPAEQPLATSLSSATGQSVQQSIPNRARRGHWFALAASGVVVAAAASIALVITQRAGSEVVAEHVAGSAAAADANTESVPAIDASAIATVQPVSPPDAGTARWDASGSIAPAPLDAAVVVTTPVDAQPSTEAETVHTTAPQHKRMGLLTVISEPWCDVFIDGKRLKSTPVLRHKLVEGAHTITLVRPSTDGGKDERRRKKVTIAPNKEYRIDETW